MIPARLLLAAWVAAIPTVLGGCVAAAVPVLAGSLLAKKQINKGAGETPGGKVRTEIIRQERTAGAEGAAPPAADLSAAIGEMSPREMRRAASRARKQAKQATKQAAPAAAAPGPEAEPTPVRLRTIAANAIPLPRAASGAPVPLTGLTALPAPGSASGPVGAPFPAFVRYALGAAKPQPGQPFRSALIDPATLTMQPERRTCDKQPPAVLIDLDPDKGAFDLDDPPAAEPGLAEQLVTLRAAGLVILWQASLPTTQSERLYSTLAATGLDPDRTDRLLLLRKPGERKQGRRQDAARDWCILAIAGDSKGDFEEAFVYLRDQKGPIAQALGTNLGDGWFLTPQPIH